MWKTDERQSLPFTDDELYEMLEMWLSGQKMKVTNIVKETMKVGHREAFVLFENFIKAL